jgi:hypothetical protein
MSTLPWKIGQKLKKICMLHAGIQSFQTLLQQKAWENSPIFVEKQGNLCITSDVQFGIFLLAIDIKRRKVNCIHF